MNFLNTKIFNNTILYYLLVLAAIVFAVILKIILAKILKVLNTKFIQKKWTFVTDEEFVSLIIKPLCNFIFVVITVIAIDELKYPTEFNFAIKKVRIFEILQKLENAIIIIYFLIFLLKSIDFVSLILVKSTSGPNDKSHDQIVIFLRDLLKIVIGIFGVLLLIKIVFNQNISNLLTGLSIIGAAVALAAKESIENLIASFIIFLDKPFFTGDTLKINNVSGKVEHIGLRSTRIRTPDRTLVTVPNKQMVDSIVDNMSMRNLRRAEIKLTLSQQSNTTQIQQLIDDTQKLLEAKPNEITKYNVHFSEFNKDGIIVLLEYFTPAFSQKEFDDLKQSINFSLVKIIEKTKIKIGSVESIIDAGANLALPLKQDNLL